MEPTTPAQNPAQEKKDAGKESGKAGDSDQRGPSADFAALINTISREAQANRKEEEREDRGKRFREYLTLIFIIATAAGVFYQAHIFNGQLDEMRASSAQTDKLINTNAALADAAQKQAEAANKQAEAITQQATAAIESSKATRESIIAAQRAWVGPQNVSFGAEPKVGEPVDLTIEYLNTGREPGTAFSYEIDSFAVGEQSPEFGTRVNPFMIKCFEKKETPPGQVVYATTGFSRYNLTAKSINDLVDEDVIKGDKVIVVQGCFIYSSEQAVRHSFFCYFYKSKFSKIANLNICPSGHHAD